MLDAKTLAKFVGTNNPHKILLEQTRGLVKKWQPTQLLEGLENENDLHGRAVLLENQAIQLLQESSRTGASAEDWSGVALPLVRKIFGEIAAKNFVSVQPMTLPSGLVFYLEFKYGSGAQPGFTSGGSVYGTTNTTGNASGGLYGGGRFGYSINDTTVTLATGSAVGAVGTSNSLVAAYMTGSVTWKDVNYDPALSASLSQLVKLSVATGGLTRPDLNGIRAFSVSSSTAASLIEYYPNYTKLNITTNCIEFITSGSGITFQIIVKYHQQPTATTRGDFEDTSTSGSAVNVDIPEIDISFQQTAIVAKTRKLKAIFTPEIIQDLNAYHSIDAEAEITSMLSEYVSMEIDLEILDMLITNAVTTEYWSALPNREYNSSTTTFDVVTSHTGTKFQWWQTLIGKIQRVSNKIHQKTMRGGANFIVVSPDIATVIESIPGFAADTNGDKMQFAMGVQKAGLLNNRWTVYKNPYMTDTAILVGFRGSSFLETGAAYCPYIPLIMTPLIYDPTNMTPRRGIMTRYAKTCFRPEFYGKVVVAYSDVI